MLPPCTPITASLGLPPLCRIQRVQVGGAYPPGNWGALKCVIRQGETIYYLHLLPMTASLGPDRSASCAESHRVQVGGLPWQLGRRECVVGAATQRGLPVRQP